MGFGPVTHHVDIILSVSRTFLQPPYNSHSDLATPTYISEMAGFPCVLHLRSWLLQADIVIVPAYLLDQSSFHYAALAPSGVECVTLSS